MKLNSLDLKFNYYDWDKNAEISHEDIYKSLYAMFKLNDFVSLRDMLYNNKEVCFEIFNNIDSLKLQFRSKDLEEKSLKCLNEEFLSVEEFNGFFLTHFQEYFQPREFDLYTKQNDEFVVRNIEQVEGYDRSIFYKEFFGDKLGERLCEIEKYALSKGNVLDDISSALSDKIEPVFYCVSEYIRALSMLILTDREEFFNEFIDKYFYSYMQISIEDCLSSCSDIFEFLNIKPALRFLHIYRDNIISKVYFAPLEIQLKFIDMNKSLQKELPLNKINKECLKYLFENDLQTFIYVCNKQLNLNGFEIIKNNYNKIENLTDENQLKDLYGLLNSLKNNLENEIIYYFKDISKKQFIALLGKFKKENREFDIDFNYLDDISFAKVVFDTYNFIKERKIKTSTTKDIIKMIKNADYIVAKLNDEEMLQSELQAKLFMCQNYFDLVNLEENLKEKLFEVEFAENIEKLKNQAEEKIKEFKNKFYQDKSYNFDKYYSYFVEKLCDTASKLSVDFDSKKEMFVNKYNEIIKNYKTQEIKDSFATSEYTFYMLKSQKMELTPIFVCFLKGIEQFLCAYINYIVIKRMVKSDEFVLTGKKYRIFNIDWNEMHVGGKDLENYLDLNFLNFNTNLDTNLKKQFKKDMKFWREEARNGNLHKNNVYNFIDVQNYIDYCYKIISALTLLII